jgi:hypothetical protein
MLKERFAAAAGASRPRTATHGDGGQGSSAPLNVRKAASAFTPSSVDGEWLDLLTAFGAVYDRMDRAGDMLSDLDRVAARAQREIAVRARDAQEEVERLQAMATADRYGKRVYLSERGPDAFHENGNRLTQREFNLVSWNRRLVTWEQYRRVSERLAGALAAHEDVAGYRDRIAAHRALTLGNVPLPPETIATIERDLDRMPDAVRHHLERRSGLNHSAARAYTEGDGFRNAPRLRAAFNAAAPEGGTGIRTVGRIAPKPAPQGPASNP